MHSLNLATEWPKQNNKRDNGELSQRLELTEDEVPSRRIVQTVRPNRDIVRMKVHSHYVYVALCTTGIEINLNSTLKIVHCSTKLTHHQFCK